jgi:S-adenosylmethionine:tRNA ribosyltransferase-isomerase
MSATTLAPGTPVTAVPVPPELAAVQPPEASGLRRDEVRLLVAGTGPLRHLLFRDLPSLLDPGDLVVVNTSATLPAAVDGRRADGSGVVVHFAGPAGPAATTPAATTGPGWVVELRQPGLGRVRDGQAGERIELPHGLRLTLRAAYPDRQQTTGSRLWLADVPVSGGVPRYLAQVGRPITYDHVDRRWPLERYQTIFARHPGSAEMPSAGRPFSVELVAALVSHGVAVVPVVLHAGVSSLEVGEAPLPERYEVPPATARLVESTRRAGGRVLAVGTTVVRALETAADDSGRVQPSAGWTGLVLGPDRPARVVDGLVTGWHDVDSSHLQLLEAVAGTDLVAEAYAAALAERYRWHEFGDACLLLPARA